MKWTRAGFATRTFAPALSWLTCRRWRSVQRRLAQPIGKADLGSRRPPPENLEDVSTVRVSARMRAYYYDIGIVPSGHDRSAVMAGYKGSRGKKERQELIIRLRNLFNFSYCIPFSSSCRLRQQSSSISGTRVRIISTSRARDRVGRTLGTTSLRWRS